VPEIPDQPEDQKRTEEQRRLAGALHSVDCGWNCGGHGIMQTVVDRKYDQMADAALRHLKIGEQEKAAYRAGREDLLRSGSCPECTAGDPHNEPDVPHIHLTPYGYLLYAADHERPGFIEEIRAVERRAGREDAAREAVDLLADMVVKCTEYGTQDGDFVASYLLPTGPVHRAIPWLDQRGINVRPGFDGRTQR
jgi:hypothetical protein